jgi:predicted ATPase
LVELAALGDSALVLPSVAQTLRVSERPAEPLLESVKEQLRSRHALLVLDNCEHVLDGCSPLVYDLLLACPRLAILATSREPLDAPGETNWRVPPLRVPDADSSLGTDEIASYEAVRIRCRVVERPGSIAQPGHRRACAPGRRQRRGARRSTRQ